jgi:hypothetical protein
MLFITIFVFSPIKLTPQRGLEGDMSLSFPYLPDGLRVGGAA